MKESLLDFLLDARRRLVEEEWLPSLPLSELRAIAEETRAQQMAPTQFLGKRLEAGEVLFLPEICCNDEMAALTGRPIRGKAPALSLLSSPEEGLLSLARSGAQHPRALFGNQVYLIRNGFFQSEFDVLETAALGFDGMCAHARGLDHFAVQYLTELCRDFGLSLILWVENEASLETVLQTDAPYLGINGFDAHDFSENTARLTQMVGRIPSACVRLAWLRHAFDRKVLLSAGIQAAVVGVAEPAEGPPESKRLDE